jgi:hypothetical protein
MVINPSHSHLTCKLRYAGLTYPLRSIASSMGFPNFLPRLPLLSYTHVHKLEIIFVGSKRWRREININLFCMISNHQRSIEAGCMKSVWWLKRLKKFGYLRRDVSSTAGYRLLLRGGIIQSVPCTANIFRSIARPYLIYNHSWSIHLSLANTSVANQEKLGEKSRWIFLTKCLSYSTGILNMGENLTTWGPRLYFPSEGNRSTHYP